jgi:hypothetical protein
MRVRWAWRYLMRQNMHSWAVEARDEAQIAPWMCAFSVFSHDEIHSFRV